jgi:hypothetical protein
LSSEEIAEYFMISHQAYAWNQESGIKYLTRQDGSYIF